MEARHEPHYYWQRMKAEFSGAKGCNVGFLLGRLSLAYHDTDVAVWEPDTGTIRLDHGGWVTCYTKERINRFLDVLDVRARLYQHRKVWHVAEEHNAPEYKDRVWCSLEAPGEATFTLTTKMVAPRGCPDCGASTHQCETGDPGCLHCDACGWSEYYTPKMSDSPTDEQGQSLPPVNQGPHQTA